MPNVAYESLGSNRERAFEIGEWFEENYDNKVRRAVAILKYVQRWTDYGYDEDNVFSAWYFHSTPVWLAVMAVATAVYIRELRNLRRTGVNVDAIFSTLPPE